MKSRGFTLIELLVVISIISLLASIVFAGLSTARAKGRDGVRYSDIHQLNIALQSYMTTAGHAPYLANCSAEGNPNAVYSESCVAISNSSGQAAGAWNYFKSNLTGANVLSAVPADPCGSNCTQGSTVLGYKYISPSVMKYLCAQTSCGLSDSQLDQTYQIYAPLETQSSVTGSAIFGSFFVPPPPSNPNHGYGF